LCNSTFKPTSLAVNLLVGLKIEFRTMDYTYFNIETCKVCDVSSYHIFTILEKLCRLSFWEMHANIDYRVAIWKCWNNLWMTTWKKSTNYCTLLCKIAVWIIKMPQTSTVSSTINSIQIWQRSKAQLLHITRYSPEYRLHTFHENDLHILTSIHPTI